ncbi:Rz1-like lysis system protein LysC [Hafnia alvei]
MLSGCSNNAPQTSTKPLVVEKLVVSKRPPAAKAVMCLLPADNGVTWGSTLTYKEQVRQSLYECNEKNMRVNELNAKI